MDYEAVIGLEVHIQLKTRTKVFCGCATDAGTGPNTRVCPVCLGHPGVLPVMNETAVRKTILAGLMIGCEISRFSKWDRKNYFYPDMPKNYQVSQYDLPLCLGGRVGKVGITRIHLEEDVAKSFHFETTSGVDFNRAGTPLMEIVSEPDMRTAQEAFDYMTALKEIMISGGISDCDMEKGQLRCDCNVSVRPVGQKQFGQKIEIKNMNSISGVKRALEYEIPRQINAVSKGEKLQQETRRWDDDAGKTFLMRTKEYAHDYRYFPEPDLMPVVVDDALLTEIRGLLPELPEAKRQRFVQQYGLPEYDAGVLVASAALANFFEKAAGKNAKAAANWIMTVSDITASPIQPEHIAELVAVIEAGQISGKQGKDVFAEMLAAGKSPAVIIKEKGLAQVSDTGAIEAFAEQALAANPKFVADYKAGNLAAVNALVGQVMKLSKGKANPQLVNGILLRKLQGS
ncbi:MAG: Asp-tRNA(Asn)/Glu-tRNA(Gln) amidotransferase subunit GatB [Verrucomicrobiota bacterium]